MTKKLVQETTAPYKLLCLGLWALLKCIWIELYTAICSRNSHVWHAFLQRSFLFYKVKFLALI